MLIETQLPLSVLEASLHNPRRVFDPEKLAELAASIRQYGVMLPITVISKAGAAGRYIIVAGERRWRASILAGKETIPAIISCVENEALLREMQLEENVQRVQLTPLEEAQAYAELRQIYGYSLSFLAQRFHRSQDHIRERLSLLTLVEEAQQAVAGERLSLGAALALSSIKDTNAQRRLAGQAVDQRLTVEQTRQLVRSYQQEQRLVSLRLKRRARREQMVSELEKHGLVVTSETYKPGEHHRTWDLSFQDCQTCPLKAVFLRDDGQIEDVCVTPTCYNSLLERSREAHMRKLEKQQQERRQAFAQILQAEEVGYEHLLYQLWIMLYDLAPMNSKLRTSIGLSSTFDGETDWEAISQWSYEELLTTIMVMCISKLASLSNERLPEGLKRSLITHFGVSSAILEEKA